MDPISLPDEQRAIYEALNNSPMDYNFQSKDQLKFEINMRTHILQNAKKIDEGDSEFSAFADSRFNPAFWIKTPYGYELRRGRLPSDAIRDVFTNSALYSFECVTTIVLIYYKSILDSIEPSIFNDLYSHLFIWGSNYNENLWMETYRGVDRIPGDVYYFYNPDYAEYGRRTLLRSRNRQGFAQKDDRSIGHPENRRSKKIRLPTQSGDPVELGKILPLQTIKRAGE